MTETISTSLAPFRRFRVLLDAIPEPAIVKDTCGRIALANEAASRLWQKTPEQLVGLTAGDLVDPASACWAEAADTIALHSSAPRLLRHRMKLRGQQQSFLVSVAPIYLTREERPDGIILVVHPNGNPALAASEAADAVAQRQFAELALIKCRVGNAAEQSEKMQRVLDFLCLPDRLASATDFSTDPLQTPTEGYWWPLKRLMES